MLKSYTDMTEQSVKIASPKNLTQTAFLCISTYYMLQLTTHISNTLRSEQAKNTTMTDFVRCIHVQKKLLLLENLYILRKLQGKVLQKLSFFS